MAQESVATDSASLMQSPSPELSEQIPVNLGESPSSNSSAKVKKATKIHDLAKKDFRSDEEIAIVIENANVEGSEISLFDVNGTEISAEVVRSEQGSGVAAMIKPPRDLKPGRYRIKVETASGDVSTQDFTWGVLAINTNKSIYQSGDNVFIAIAVLDETGEMVCDAEVELGITSPDGNLLKLNTTDGTIIVNPQCFSKDLTVVPDYQANYKTEQAGSYQMQLSATTPDGTYTIHDAFEVNDQARFDVDRLSATRIYPPLTYPVTMKVVASEDFAGVIEERVPASFEITPLQDTTGFDQVEMQAETDNQVVYDQSLYNIGKPFKEEYPMSLSFGRQHRDPTLSQKYTAFGVTGHDGVDFALPEGSQVVAVADGKVVKSGEGDYGVTIVIEHTWGKSYYGHLSKVLKSEGDEIKKGQLIALSGSTGLSSGPHLHFGVKPNQNDFENGYYGKVNPITFFDLEDASEEQGVVAGVSTQAEQVTAGTKIIRWNVDLKKGAEITLGYQFDAPDISPELYRLGPLKFVKDGSVVFEESREWQIAADSVAVSGGITSAEAQFGGLQRKVAYVNSNWYAFYTDANDVWYTKSADGITWGSPVDMDSGDADNYNPSIDVSGNFIHVVWIDDITNESFQVKTIDTGSSDTLTGVCSGPSEGTIGSTFIPTIAALSSTTAMISLADSSSDTEVNLYEVTGITGVTCTPTITDVHLGNLTFGAQGSGLTASDNPVLVGLSSTTAMLVYQDGSNLRSSTYDTTADDWKEQQLIANVSDTTYSVTTDGTKIWVLSQNSTTGTRLYKRNGAEIVETQIDSDAGANGDDADSEISMFCTSASDCKIVYTDDIDTAAPTLIFRDCDDEDCSTGASTTLDSDIGAANDQAGASVFCLSNINCKVAYGDDMNTTTPALEMIDCANDECSSPSVSNEIVGDLGSSAAILHSSIYCLTDANCKIVYGGADSLAVGFVDCPDATCTGTSTSGTCTSGDRTCTVLDTNAGALSRVDLYCVASDNCKVVYHDNNATSGCADVNSICFVDCTADEDCSTNTQTVLDSAAGTTSGATSVAIDCVGGDTECSVLYGDVADVDLTFIDCEGSATCATGATATDIDIQGGGTGSSISMKIDLHCPTNDNCKFFYVGETTAGSENSYFGECNNETCTAGSAYEVPGPRLSGALYCPASNNCKMAYYDGTTGTNPTVQFADCDSEDCAPQWTSLTAPWTTETNVTSLSLTYDSTNSDLIASIIMDTSELAYYITSDATTISWSGETAYDFTAGDLDNLSTPETVAGNTNMGALLRQGSNLEFDLLAGAAVGPTMDQVMRHGSWFSGGSQQAFTF